MVVSRLLCVSSLPVGSERRAEKMPDRALLFTVPLGVSPSSRLMGPEECPSKWTLPLHEYNHVHKYR